MKKLLLLIIISGLFISCYIDDKSSESGSITINLSDEMKATLPPNSKLKLRFFNEGDMTVIKGPVISYISGYPTEVPVAGPVEFSYSSTDSEGTDIVTGVPSDTPLQILAEYIEEGFFGDEDWRITKADLSDSFTVSSGENTDVTIGFIDANFGSGVRVINKNTDLDNVYFRIFADEDYNDFVSISGSDIIDLNTGTEIVSEDYGTEESGYYEYIYAILPGRKFRLLISENSNIDNFSYPHVGISGTFEVLPGLSESVSVTYYTYTSSGLYS